MKRMMLGLILCGFVSLSQFHGAGAAMAADKSVADLKKKLKTEIADLDALFERARLDARAPGLVYGIVVDGALVHSKGLGARNLEAGANVTAGTPFRIASMTKMMTAQLIGDLQDQGKIYLDAPAELYAPELTEWKYPSEDSPKITVRDLLNHTAGFVTDNPWADRFMDVSPEALTEILQTAQPFSRAPGETWQYSNLGYVILGRILENVTQKSFQEILHAKILDPLKMKDSGLEVDAYPRASRAIGYNWVDGEHVEEPVLGSGAFDPLGGVWTTADDYARYLAWMLSAWPPRDDEDDGPIPRRVVRMPASNGYVFYPSTPPGDDGCTMAASYAMGLSVYRHCSLGRVYGHGGGFPGYGSYVLLAPERGVAVFVFMNKTYASGKAVLWEAMDILDSAGVTGRLPSPSADPRMLEAYENLGKAYAAGNLEAAGLSFSRNFFLDRSKTRWVRQLEDIKSAAGSCDVKAPLRSSGALKSSFTWDCQYARVKGYMIMSPLNPANIQELHVREVLIDSSGDEVIVDSDFH